MSPDLQHKHVIFRIETNTPPTEVQVLSDWMAGLIKTLNMKLYDGPYVKYLNEAGNRGLTGVAILKTSHCSCHVWDEPTPGIMQLDVYTCGAMDLDVVVRELQVFNPIKTEYKMLDRESNLQIIGEGFA